MLEDNRTCYTYIVLKLQIRQVTVIQNKHTLNIHLKKNRPFVDRF